MKINEWTPQDRPREKLINKGAQSLTDTELLAIILRSGTREKSVFELSTQILNDYDLNQLGALSIEELTSKYKGIGETKAVTLFAAIELGRRRNRLDSISQESFTSSRSVYTFFHSYLSDVKHEEFWVAYLNRANKLIAAKQISKGGISETSVDVRIILKEALIRLASSVILCHNHPSGNIRPSDSDDLFTKRFKDAAQLMNISVLDHIIVANDSYYSYADESRIL